ncbi:MAG TPA: nuclear transport factor 2 family protein [Chitinophagaceae bacterium]
MTNQEVSDKIELTELANKLFMYTDAQEWKKLLAEVFVHEIWFDVGNGEPKILHATEICEKWREGFIGLDAVHHQAGQYLITSKNDTADIYGYAVALHYKKVAAKGNSRTFIGSYDLKAIRTEKGWRLSQFKYNLKFIDGNTTLE